MVPLSISHLNAGQHQDTGAKRFHTMLHTSSSIVSKSIAISGGKELTTGQVTFNKRSKKSVSPTLNVIPLSWNY